MTGLVQIKGNTYPVRDQLAALGGRWSKALGCWLVPEANAEAARALVPSGGKRCGGVRVSRTCKTCGIRINYGVYCGKCEYS